VKPSCKLSQASSSFARTSRVSLVIAAEWCNGPQPVLFLYPLLFPLLFCVFTAFVPESSLHSFPHFVLVLSEFSCWKSLHFPGHCPPALSRCLAFTLMVVEGKILQTRSSSKSTPENPNMENSLLSRTPFPGSFTKIAPMSLCHGLLLHCKPCEARNSSPSTSAMKQAWSSFSLICSLLPIWPPSLRNTKSQIATR
jgi:hypothetical protein